MRPVDFPPTITNRMAHMVGKKEGDGLCRWFLKCFNEATQTQNHPVLGDVPVCDSCKEFAK